MQTRDAPSPFRLMHRHSLNQRPAWFGGRDDRLMIGYGAAAVALIFLIEGNILGPSTSR
jgi:hypothetical protein